MSVIIEIVYDTSPVLSGVGSGIWILFIFYFALRLTIVANRMAFLKKNWLFILAIVVSALRFFPFLQPFPLVRALTATFGMQVIWNYMSEQMGAWDRNRSRPSPPGNPPACFLRSNSCRWRRPAVVRVEGRRSGKRPARRSRYTSLGQAPPSQQLR
jgi:hypothetical protein